MPAAMHTRHHGMLEQLPVELLDNILSRIDDLPSLLSAILASRTLYNVFTGAKRAILKRVVVSHVGAQVIAHALTAVQITDMIQAHVGPQVIVDALAAVRIRDMTKAHDLLTVDQVHTIAKLSSAVRAFTKLFVDSASGVRPELQTQAPSPDEVARIEIAFYLFETFRNTILAQPDDWFHIEWAGNLFLASLAPWEVEQLGCIHDFLFHQIKPAYDDIVEHDVIWGSIEVEPALNYACPEVQAIMTLGLISIYKIATAETYPERHQLLYRSMAPARREDFLHDALTIYTPNLQSLQGPSQEAPSSSSGRYLGHGPQDAWEWAHANLAPRLEVYRLDCTDLRKWGYVFWDKARLEAMSLFSTPFQPPLHVAEAHEVDDEFEASWWARKNIARAGGTGYWSRTDQSQVVYPPAKQLSGPSHPRAERRVGHTLADAKGGFEAASARIEAAMENKKMRTADSED